MRHHFGKRRKSGLPGREEPQLVLKEVKIRLVKYSESVPGGHTEIAGTEVGKEPYLVGGGHQRNFLPGALNGWARLREMTMDG